MRKMFLALVAATLCLLAGPSATAQPAAAELEREFRTWIENEVWPAAASQGVSRQTFDAAFAIAELDLSLPELVLPGDPGGARIAQAEFSAPGNYFGEENLAALTRLGRELAQSHATTLAAVERQYGVPSAIVLAIWGRETSFGRVSIPHYGISALATGAFLGRRNERFLSELIAALVVLEQGHVTPEQMRSSWAGGMGMPQFVPSSFLDYAVDFDADGRKDIWTSVPDTLASIANYLRSHGWNPAERWGAEIVLPETVSCRLEGPEQGLPLAGWRLAGIDLRDGRAGEMRYLVAPAGRLGPAFLVSGNFYVLKEYNRSDLYAIYIGHLADRISGLDNAIDGRWLPLDAPPIDAIQRMQLWLVASGYQVSTTGIMGYETRIAVGAVQAASGWPETCFPERPFLEGMGL